MDSKMATSRTGQEPLVQSIQDKMRICELGISYMSKTFRERLHLCMNMAQNMVTSAASWYNNV